jgi:hypothetical protein
VTPSSARDLLSLPNPRRWADPVRFVLVGIMGCVVGSSCRRDVAPPPVVVPADTAETQAVIDELGFVASSVRRYQGFVRIRGRGPEGGFSGRLVVVFERPDRLRVELLGAFGSTRWSAVAGSNGITVVFPGPKQYVEDPNTADVVGRLLGIRLTAHEVMALLAGVGVPLSDESVANASHQGPVTLVDLESRKRLELDENGQIALVQASSYRVSYPTPWKRQRRQVPDTIRLETDTLSVTLTPEDVDVNVALASEAFEIEIPDGAQRLRPSDVVGEAVFVVTQDPK